MVGLEVDNVGVVKSNSVDLAMLSKGSPLSVELADVILVLSQLLRKVLCFPHVRAAHGVE